MNFGGINRTHKKEGGYEREFWMDESKVKNIYKEFWIRNQKKFEETKVVSKEVQIQSTR